MILSTVSLGFEWRGEYFGQFLLNTGKTVPVNNHSFLRKKECVGGKYLLNYNFFYLLSVGIRHFS